MINNSENYSHLTEKLTCNKSSQMLGLQFGLKNVHYLKEADFCNAEAGKTCCDYKNHQELKLEFSKKLHNLIPEGISQKCINQLRMIFCSDCDGDIGIGLRKGICQQNCSGLYYACIDDYFETVETRLQFCKNDSPICWKLKDWKDSGDNIYLEFCKNLGIKVNPKYDLSNEVISKLSKYNNLALNKNFSDDEILEIKTFLSNEAICYNGQPSSNINGKANNILKTEATLTEE